MRPFALIAFLSLTACPSPRGPAAAGPVRPEVVRLIPDTARYHVALRQRVEQTVRDQPLVSILRRDLWVAAELTPADGGLGARWVLDSLAVEAPGGPFGPPETAAARGSAYHAIVREGASVARVELDRERTDLLDAVGEQLRELLPPLPSGGARIGASWIDTTEHDLRAGGITVTGRTVRHHRVAGWTTWADAPALEIVSEGRYTLTGSGAHAGQEIMVEGTGRRHGHHYLDPAGRALGGTGVDSASLEVRLVASHLVIPVRQWTADTVEARR
jgi:hypothetical protein